MGFDNLVGQMLGQYELRELLGAGGMGAVYRAYQASLRREVAVKVLPGLLARDPEYLKRFNREAEIAASLEHPNIVPIHDYGTQRNISYVVMRLLTGGSLADRLRESAEDGRPLPSMAEISTLLRQLGSALDYAHNRGVVHRDIKPGNVMFDNQGSAYLVDFGIARLMNESTGLTGSGNVIGTTSYIAPELWSGETASAASDQYALAIMVYEILTGRRPFNASTPVHMMHQHLNELPTPPQTYRADVPRAVTLVLDRALEKAPDKRFPTITALAQAFDAAVVGTSQETTGLPPKMQAPRRPSRPVSSSQPQSVQMPLPKPSRRNPILVGTAITLVILAAFAIAAAALMNSSARETSLNATLTAIAIAAAPSATTTPSAIPSPTEHPSETSAPVVIVLPSATNTLTNDTAMPAPSETPTSTEPPTASPLPSSTSTVTEAPSATSSATSTLTEAPSATPSATTAPVIALVIASDTPTASLTPTITSSPTLTATESNPMVISLAATGRSVVVRSGDGKNDSYGLLPSRASALLISISDRTGWYQIQLSDGRIGWVSPTLIKVEGDISSVPHFSPTIAPTSAVRVMTVSGVSSSISIYDGDASSTVVEKLQSNQSAILLAISNRTGWYYVQLPDGRNGWVAPTRVQVDGEIANIPHIGATATSTPTSDVVTFTARGFVTIHEQPDASSKIVFTMASNSIALIIRTSVASPDWYYVSIAGSQGWVPARLGSITGDVSSLPSLTISSTLAPTGIAAEVTVTAQGFVTVHEQPDASSKTVFTMPPNAVATIIRTSVAAPDWYYIVFSGTQGWVQRKLVAVNDGSSGLHPFASDPTPTTSPVTKIAPTLEVTGTPSAIRYLIPSDSMPNGILVFADPDPSSAGVGTLNPGKSALVLARTGTGMGWYQIELTNGVRGWVNGTVVQLLGDTSYLRKTPAPAAATVTSTQDATPRVLPISYYINGAPVHTGDGVNDSWKLLPPGKTAIILATSDRTGWYQIQLSDGTTGWVSPGTITVSGNLNSIAHVEPTATEAVRVVSIAYYGDGVPVYDTDSTSGKQLGLLTPNQQDIILSCSASTRWYEIRLPDGTQGWVAPNSVKVIGDTSHLPCVVPPTSVPSKTLAPATPKPIPTATPVPAVGFLGILFQTNFDSLPASFEGDGWRLVQAGGQTRYCIDNRNNAFGTYPKTTFGSLWANYMVEVDIQITSDTGHAALMTRLSYDADGYRHALDINAGNADSAQYFSGSSTDYDSLGYRSFTLRSGQWYQLRAEVDGNQIRTFVNELPISRQADKRRTIGNTAIEAGPGTEACIDNLVVRALERTQTSLNSAQKGISSASSNLRSGAGTNFPVVGGVLKGATVYIIDKSPDDAWYYVRDDSTSTQGWVSATFIQLQ